MKRLALIVPSYSYRSNDFIDAANHIGAEVLIITDADLAIIQANSRTIHADLNSPTDSMVEVLASAVMEFGASVIMSVDDQGARLASKLSEMTSASALPMRAVEVTSDKAAMRRVLRYDKGSEESFDPSPHHVTQPAFQSIPIDPGMYQVESLYDRALEAAINVGGFPVVVKPTRLSGSRGVTKVTDVGELRSALELARQAISLFDADVEELLIEQYIAGHEYAIDGYVDSSGPQVLVIFDKPEPMDGPFFEEMIYLIPPNLPLHVEASIISTVTSAVKLLGISSGPFHAEVRVNDAEVVYLLEVASRSIGGKCSRSVRFANGRSLEEMILGSQLDMSFEGGNSRERMASGVLMIPTPATGRLRGFMGIDLARNIPHVTDIDTSSTPIGTLVRKVPLADRYLGFVYARGPGRGAVLDALQKAREVIVPDIAIEEQRETSNN